ncbi:zinc ribbon domain-containing protein [Bacillus litorisediminis]|uniref:zinc ribbon domain-containing protein n=1 Tax=Bacillus litorisediminis TaxID=2922713 RepID=UPI001FABEF8A|nr:zinc ribbon domain-containing protein [Bacillus litorisediminis]
MKKFGPLILIIGLAGFVIFLIDFASSDFFEEPKYFWVGFASMPVIFIGAVLSMPAIKQKYLKQNEEILREQMKIMGEAFREGFYEDNKKFCSNCGDLIEKQAKFCSICGNPQ